jgi:DNA-binding NtrC family response regulator
MARDDNRPKQQPTLRDAAKVADETEHEKGVMHLLVMGPDVFESHTIENPGNVTVGRDPTTANVVLMDPKASRQHARFHLADELRIEDLGSANGTWLREEKIAPHRPVRLWPGEAVRIGSLVLMVQRQRSATVRRVWPLSYLEVRLGDCCSLGAGAPPAALARLKLAEPVTPARFAAEVAPVFRSQDVFSLYAPSDFEVLLPALDAKGVSDRVAEAAARLVQAGFTVRSAVVTFPEDGRDPETLQSALGDRLRGLAPGQRDAAEIVIRSERMVALLTLAGRAALTTVNILIQGETGSGKDMLARFIHGASARRDGPFVVVNCAALSPTLVESELFGHERGAFTGADARRTGLLAAAAGGTAFLDEVGELPLQSQAKLLRAIETREIMPVGSVESRKIDVRFVAATNRDLENAVAEGAFRSDLYFRLNGFALQVLPLRERRDDILPMARRFLATAGVAMGLDPVPDLSANAALWLERYAWPGNVRELRNVIERALILCDGDTIEPEHLPIERIRSAPAAPRALEGLSPQDEETRLRLIQILEACGGNQTRAAEQMGVSRKVLITMMKEYGLPRPRKASHG